MSSINKKKSILIGFFTGLQFHFADAAYGQLLAKQATLSLTMEPTTLLSNRQVYSIAPSQFMREIERQLTGAGIVVAPSSEATRLMIDIKSYDSGPYIGLSKTARIAVAYQLRDTSGGLVEVWTDKCEARVGLDAQDAADRNRSAVALCLTMLGARLAEKLAGPAVEVLVR